MELADRDGLHALSMRRIATELGVATAALYRHFPDRDTLLAAMTELALGENPPPPDDLTGWRARLAYEARAEWRLYRDHPWILPVLARTRPPVSPALLDSLERFFAALDRPGITRDQTPAIYLSVSGLVQGLALLPSSEHGPTTGAASFRATAIDLVTHGTYPTLSRHFAPRTDDLTLNFDHLLEDGLTLLLDGIAAHHFPDDRPVPRSGRVTSAPAGGGPDSNLGRMTGVADRSLGPELARTTEIDADVLVVGLVTTEDGPAIAPDDAFGDVLDAQVRATLLEQLRAVGAKGKADELTRIPAVVGLRVSSVLAVGLGAAEKVDAEQIRKSAGVAGRALAGTGTAVTTLSGLDLGPAAEGFYLGAYSFTPFRSDKSAPKPDEQPVRRVEFLVPEPGFGEEALFRAQATAEAVATARDFVNTPPSHLYPAEFAARAQELAEAAGLEVEVLDEKALADQGFGGILGVGKGSSRPPRLIRIAYRGGAKKVALIGKGITFDTGGISIKPAANMENMTSDMAGAAAIIATVLLAARLSLPVTVVATVPMAENMPSDTAQRPGDVLTQYGGTTVEVVNTDAEGRLVLADAIVRAGEDEPEYLIDVATLTGAQVVALGTRTPGVMGTDEFRDRVARVSQQVGENGWAMPLPAELRADLNSKIADLANVTPHRNGGMLAAGLFLREFVPEGVQWAHLDVAGPAYNTGGPFGYIGKGGTGVPVRTLLAVLDDIAAE